MKFNSILITGGAGFIGSELTRQLCGEDTHITVVDNLVNGKRENLDGLPTHQVKLIVEDIRNTDRMAGLLHGVDIVFHLACLGVRHSVHDPHENHAVNATATLHLLSLAKEAGIKRFVNVSSSEVYGTAQRVPMTEAHSTYPMTIYGAAKLAGECYARAFHRTYGFPTVVVRPFNAYGPRSHHEGDSGEVIPKFMLRAMAGLPMMIFGDGNQTRDFTYVTDTTRGILLAGFSDATIGETINIGNGAETSVNDLSKEIAKVVGKPDAAVMHDTPRPGDVLRLFADISHAKQLLGYEPLVNLTEGLKHLMEWYLCSGKSPGDLLEDEIMHNWQKGEHD